MSVDMRQVALGAMLLLASSAFLLETDVDGRVPAVIAAFAAACTVVASLRAGRDADGAAA
ncbi:hypothetical protein [Halopelagius longus]|uniref:Uncharacterized protein n=1 Tax=Halopelagius longus TaxID=1236180 RepID=A0A1H1C2H2_9EURY|nr:hypothetical protein [Halopelagius longus]RDI71038.1 hypothetical protein DWB78_04440 [Halopelagius longus]SDQ58402.1 hypothetical protein SAMN05216278_2079 [Halopelagius longus]